MKLLLIHGSGLCGIAWRYQTDHFRGADAVDLPGHPKGKACTSIEDYTAWLRQYISYKKYRDVVLAGHSLGSAIAQLYALTYPDGLKALILIGAGARLRVHPRYLEALEKAKNDPSVLEAWMDDGGKNVEPSFSELMKKRALEIGAAVFLSDMQCCDRFDVMARVHEIRVPTLVICGSDDVMTPLKYARYLTTKIKGAREVVIPGAGHRVFAEKPQEVNRAIENFLHSLPA